MIAHIRIPTTQYGYIEVELDGTEEEIIIKHNELLVFYHASVSLQNASGEGLDSKTYNEALDKYLTDQTGNLDTYNRMSREQQNVIQCLKKAFKRLEAKEGQELRTRE